MKVLLFLHLALLSLHLDVLSLSFYKPLDVIP